MRPVSYWKQYEGPNNSRTLHLLPSSLYSICLLWVQDWVWMKTSLPTVHAPLHNLLRAPVQAEVVGTQPGVSQDNRVDRDVYYVKMDSLSV